MRTLTDLLLLQLLWCAFLAEGSYCPAGSEPTVTSEVLLLVKECNLTAQTGSACSLTFSALSLSDSSQLNISISTSPLDTNDFSLVNSFSILAFTEKSFRDSLGSNCSDFDVYSLITKTSDVAPNADVSIKINGTAINQTFCSSLLARVQLSYRPACQLCAEGSFKGPTSLSCEPCPSPSTSPQGSTSLENCTCRAGYTGSNTSDCQGCPVGQFKAMMGFQACDDCPVGAYSDVQGSSVCTSCPIGMTSVGGSSSCICAGGYIFKEPFLCLPCPAGSFKNVTGNGTCTVCSDGKFAANNGSDVCVACPLGKYRENPPNYTETDAVSCHSCFSDSSTAVEGSVTIDSCKCRAGFKQQGYTCSACPALTYTAQAGMTECTSCDPGYFSHIASTACTVDIVDVSVEMLVAEDVERFSLYHSSNLSEVISTLFFLPLDRVHFVSADLVVTSQPNNTVLEENNVSSYNASNYTNSSNTSSYNESSSSSTSSSPVVKAIWRITVARSFLSSFLQTFDRQLFLHEQNASQVVSITFIEQCGAGRQKNETGACVPCPVGTFKNASGDSQCLPCRSNSSTAADGQILSTGCLCIPGFESVGYESPCQACAPGSFSSVLGNDACQLCPANTYSSHQASTSCQSCPASSLSAEGSPSLSSCLCAAGYRPDVGATSFACRMCPVNTYKNFSGNTDCLSCPPHSISSMRTVDIKYCRCDFGYTGPNTNCTPCPAGSYKEYPGPFRCEKCGSNLYSTRIAAVSSLTCTSCPNNTVSSPGSGSINSCQCIQGYGSNLSTSCTLCPVGTYKYFVATLDCLTCPGNFSTQQTGSTSCECSAGFQLEEGKCVPCRVGTWKNYTSNETCTACPPLSFTVPGAIELTDCICNAGYEWKDNGCSFCPFGKIRSDLSSSSCQPCPPGRSSDATRTVCTCDQYTYTNATTGNCQECLPFTGCAQGEWWMNCSQYENAACMPCSGLQPCPDGFYWDFCQAWADAQCRPCTNNKPLNSHFTRPGLPGLPGSCPAWACNQGYEEAGGACIVCPRGKYSNRGQPSCTECPGATDALLPGQGFCRACKQGFYIESYGMDGHAVCTACPDNSTTTPNQHIYSFSSCRCSSGHMGFSWACQPCQPGTYKPNVTGSTDLQLYLDGFKTLDLCVRCPPMTFNELTGQSFTSSCIPCLPGSTAEEGAASCTCPAGYYDTDASGQAHCLPCPPNTFNARAGQLGSGSCLPCPNSSFATEGQAACFCYDGYFSAGQCLGCPAGKYKQSVGCASCPMLATSREGSVSKDQCFCQAGYYGSNASSCMMCPLNTTSLPGATSLSDCFCEAGFYGYLTNCLKCPLLSNSSAGSTNLSNCTCVAGSAGNPSMGLSCKLCSLIDSNSYSWESSFNCSCNPGYFGSFVEVDGRVQVNCSQCPEGTYSPSPAATHCLSCPSNKTSQLASTSLSSCVCPAGTVEANGECVTSAATRRLFSSLDNFSCPSSSSQTMSGSCLCDPGYSGSNGSPPCSPCTEGSVARVAGSEVCTTCPAGSVPNQERTSCVCPQGQYGRAGSCVRCPSGMLAAAGSGDASDCQCEEGFYLDEEERTCRRCPKGATSRRGSAAITDCFCARGFYGRPWEEERCSACAANASSEENATRAEECFCSAGFYAEEGEGLICRHCPPRSFSLPGSQSRASCICDEGFYGRLAAGEDCSPCPANALAVNRRLLPSDCLCMEGFFAAASGRCLSCPADSHSSLGSRSVHDCVCNVGYFGIPGTMSSSPTCQACPAGKYSWGPVRLTEDSCLPCPPHSTSNASSASREDCKCAAGYCKGEGDSWECTACSCPAGPDSKMCLSREL